jgi:hypothetical protein
MACRRFGWLRALAALSLKLNDKKQQQEKVREWTFVTTVVSL